jgi:hypothetical protein
MRMNDFPAAYSILFDYTIMATWESVKKKRLIP